MTVLPRDARVVATLPVYIDGHAGAFSADLSRTGFCIESTAFLPPTSWLSGTVLHGRLKLAFSGHVVWAEAGNPMGSTWHRMGICFDRLSPGLRALLGLTLERRIEEK
jgi:PilZ domain